MAADIQKIITDAADKYEVPTEALMAIASIESNFDPLADNPRSSAGGLFQFVDRTAKGMGLTDRYDPVAAADAAARMTATNIKSLRKTLGREPTTGELYLAHQQGLGGARALLANPNETALTVLTRVYRGRKDRAMAALVQNGGNVSMTAGEFAGKWTSKGDAAVGRLPGDSSSRGGAAYTSSREGVQRLQSELKRMGFDPGKVDGVMGPRTKSAIRRFQDANGLEVDGVVGPETATALSAMGSSSIPVPGSQNYRNVTGVAPAGVSVSPRYNPNVGIGDTGNAAMSVTPRVPFEANFRDPADPILNNISPERAKLMSRGLDMNVSRAQSAKDVLIGGFGALLGKPFPMGSAPASGANVSQFYTGILPAPASSALTSTRRATLAVDGNGNIIDRTTGAKVGQSEPSVFANTGLNTLRRQIGFTDASRVAPAVPAAISRPAAPVATPYLPGMTLPRPASVPATTRTVRTDGTVVSGVGGAGQVRTSQIPANYRPASALPFTPASIFSTTPRLTGFGGMTGTNVKPTAPIPTKLTGFGGMTGTNLKPTAPIPLPRPSPLSLPPIPLPRNARPVAPANTALAATSQLAGVKPVSKNVSSYSGSSSSSGGGFSSSAPIEGSSTGKLYNVGQTYTTGGGLKYVAQADGSFKKV
jgi:peptidoglycan hydrolase-like protein with peptidoglycan-binding domain